MKSIFKQKPLNLPKIKQFEINEDPHDNALLDDQQQINRLDEWTQMVPVAKRKKKITKKTDTLVFLYKNQGRFVTTRHSRFQNQQFSQIGMFLAKVNHELYKIKAVNYSSIYQNLQYCSGVYENQFNTLLKTLENHKKELEQILCDKGEEINNMRHEHITNINDLMKSKENLSCTTRIALAREKIEMKENELQPLKQLLKEIENSKIKVLKFALALGYDVREEGLIWILRQLNTLPKQTEFPEFLNEKEKEYIISKHLNKFKLSEIEKEKKNVEMEEKQILKEAYNNVERDKKRKLSMIKEQELLEKIKRENGKQRLNNHNHKYLNEDTLKLVSENHNVKATKYEIIYKETVKKLNRLCIEEIYGKNKLKSNPIKEDGIFEQVQKAISESIKLKQKQEQIKTAEEKELFEILKVLRNQRYEQNSPKHRNPISVLCCLLGWKKAKKIIEQEMSISLVASF